MPETVDDDSVQQAIRGMFLDGASPRSPITAHELRLRGGWPRLRIGVKAPATVAAVVLLVVVLFTATPLGHRGESTGKLNSPHPASTSPPSTIPATTSVPMPTTTTTQTAVEPTTAPAHESGSACQNGQLSATSTAGFAGLDHRDLVIVFQNVSSSTCVLMGWPGVAGLNAQGVQVAQAARKPSEFNGGGLPTGQTTPPAVTLSPGQVASTTVNGLDSPVGTSTPCTGFASFLVTPPNLTQSQTVSSSPNQGNYIEPFPNCAQITVTPVVPGNTGALG
jgi:hypothetical protein